MFGHGPMIATLADVHMLTSLRITGPLQPYHLLSKVESKLVFLELEGGVVTSSLIKASKGALVNMNMWPS